MDQIQREIEHSIELLEMFSCLTVGLVKLPDTSECEDAGGLYQMYSRGRWLPVLLHHWLEPIGPQGIESRWKGNM